MKKFLLMAILFASCTKTEQPKLVAPKVTNTDTQIMIVCFPNGSGDTIISQIEPLQPVNSK